MSGYTYPRSRGILRAWDCVYVQAMDVGLCMERAPILQCSQNLTKQTAGYGYVYYF